MVQPVMQLATVVQFMPLLHMAQGTKQVPPGAMTPAIQAA